MMAAVLLVATGLAAWRRRQRDTAGLWDFEELRFGADEERLGEFVLGFGQDLSGEIYVLTSETGTPTGSTGKVHRLVLR